MWPVKEDDLTAAVKNRFSRRRGSEEKSGQGIKKRVPLIDERKIEVQ
jgi:hypothetical protein